MSLLATWENVLSARPFMTSGRTGCTLNLGSSFLHPRVNSGAHVHDSMRQFTSFSHYVLDLLVHCIADLAT